MAELLERYKATVIAAVLLAAALLALAVAFLARGTGEGRLIARVHDADGTVHELPLDTDARLEVETSLGSNTVVVEAGSVRMEAADCPHGDCLRQRALSSPGGQIICLPHELWIEVVADGAGEPAEMDADAVAYDDVDTVAR